jgi:hypothetical protein
VIDTVLLPASPEDVEEDDSATEEEEGTAAEEGSGDGNDE